MNWVDFVIVGALIFFALTAIGRSFLSELLDLISFLLAGVFKGFLGVPPERAENPKNTKKPEKTRTGDI